MSLIKKENNIYLQSEETIQTYNLLYNYMFELFNNNDSFKDLVLFEENIIDIRPVNSKIFLEYKNKILKKSINLVDGFLYYNQINIQDNNQLLNSTYLYSNDDIIFLINDYIETIENDIVEIWESNHAIVSDGEELSFYNDCIINIHLYYLSYIDRNLDFFNYKFLNDSLKNLYFSLITSNSKVIIEDSRDNYFLKDKVLLLNDLQQFYIYNHSHKKGSISTAIYVKKYV